MSALARHTAVCFNSLFEMPWFDELRPGECRRLRCFNSLFEMPRRSLVGVGGSGALSFNSLFEMLGLVKF